MGLTHDGAFYYSVRTGTADVYLAALDPQTGAVLSPPTPLTQHFVGSNRGADWSPDGKFLVYVSQRGLQPLFLGQKIVVRSLATGEEREITPRLLNFDRRPRWSPDGRFFLVHGQDAKGQAGFFNVNVQTGEATLVLREESPGYIQWPSWSPDGKTIFYFRNAPVGGKAVNRLRAHNLETGEDRELYGEREHVNNIGVSPDGRWIVAPISVQKEPCLALIPVQGGEPRVLVRLQETDHIAPFSDMAWTPDGKYILFIKIQGDPQQHLHELWRIPAEGGTPQKVGISMKLLRGLRVHPDGQHIVFTAGLPTAEVWVLENFLPALKAAK
jgi:Tol biopolymer transport system component